VRAPDSLTVVVPVFNEGANIRRWWELAGPHLPGSTRVLVVYDFEQDDTLPAVRALQAEGAPLDLLPNSGRGVLRAIVTGLRAVERGPVLVSMADLSDEPGSIAAMLEAYRRGADVVVASRFMPGGQLLGGPRLKGWLARWGSLSLRRLAGFPVHDATNSFRLYDAELVRAVEIESTGGFELGMELTLKAWMMGRQVAEVPSTWRARDAGTSRFRLASWLPRYAALWARAMAFGLVGRRRRRAARGPSAHPRSLYPDLSMAYAAAEEATASTATIAVPAHAGASEMPSSAKRTASTR